MADLTITIPDAQVPRVLAAFEETFSMEAGTADAARVREHLLAEIKAIVRTSEIRVADKGVRDTFVDVDVS